MPPERLDDLASRRRALLGDEIRRIRQGRGWTQEDLAHEAGIDRKSVNRVEQGNYSPSVDRLFVIADALGVAASTVLAAADAARD